MAATRHYTDGWRTLKKGAYDYLADLQGIIILHMSRRANRLWMMLCADWPFQQDASAQGFSTTCAREYARASGQQFSSEGARIMQRI